MTGVLTFKMVEMSSDELGMNTLYRVDLFQLEYCLNTGMAVTYIKYIRSKVIGEMMQADDLFPQ